MSTAFVPSPAPPTPDSHPNYFGETYPERVKRKCKENPLVPLGCLITCGCLIVATVRMRQRRSHDMNYWLRARVLAQAATVALVVAGTYASGATKGQKQERARIAQDELIEQAGRERRAFEERLRAAEEAQRMEDEGGVFRRQRAGGEVEVMAVGADGEVAEETRGFWQKVWGSGKS